MAASHIAALALTGGLLLAAKPALADPASADMTVRPNVALQWSLMGASVSKLRTFYAPAVLFGQRSANGASLPITGAFADLALVQFVGSFLFFESPVSLATQSTYPTFNARPGVKVLPARLSGGGYGLTARATFF